MQLSFVAAEAGRDDDAYAADADGDDDAIADYLLQEAFNAADADADDGDDDADADYLLQEACY